MSPDVRTAAEPLEGESPRPWIARALGVLLPELLPVEWIIVAAPDAPRQVNRDQPYVTVFRSEILPDPSHRGALLNELQLNVYGHHPGLEPAAEDELDALADAVLTALEALPGLSISKAERLVFRDGKFNGWTITTTVRTSNRPRAHQLTTTRGDS